MSENEKGPGDKAGPGAKWEGRLLGGLKAVGLIAGADCRFIG